MTVSHQAAPPVCFPNAFYCCSDPCRCRCAPLLSACLHRQQPSVLIVFEVELTAAAEPLDMTLLEQPIRGCGSEGGASLLPDRVGSVPLKSS